MTFPEFEKFQDELHREIIKIASTKGKEYAHDTDRFANFRRLAAQLDLKDYQIGWVYATKHLDSIVSYMKEGRTFSTESIRGRFLDAILYLELIAGMVEDSEGNKRFHEGVQAAHAKNMGYTVTCDRCGLMFGVSPEYNMAQHKHFCGVCRAKGAVGDTEFTCRSCNKKIMGYKDQLPLAPNGFFTCDACIKRGLAGA